MAKVGLRTKGGVIDASYRGEVQLMLSNRDPKRAIHIYAGDYIAQIVIIKIYEQELEEVQELDETERGQGGFGSTGINAAVLKKEVTEIEHKQQKTDKHGYKISECTTNEQKEQIKKLMHEFEDILATSFEEIQVREPKYLHDIDTGDHRPIKKAPYRVPPAYRAWQREENQQLEESGVTRKSKSPWGTPSIIVPKKGAEPGKFAPSQYHEY